MPPSLYADPELYDLMAQMTAPEDLAFYEAMVDERGGPVLELGCGTGRLSIPLAKHVELWALDRSEPMLQSLRDKAEALGITIRARLGDMRDFELERQFSTVILPYNAFNHLRTLDDVQRCLASVRRHLLDGGRIVIDTDHPDPQRLHVSGGPEERLFRYRDPSSCLCRPAP